MKYKIINKKWQFVDSNFPLNEPLDGISIVYQDHEPYPTILFHGSNHAANKYYNNVKDKVCNTKIILDIHHQYVSIVNICLNYTESKYLNILYDLIQIEQYSDIEDTVIIEEVPDPDTIKESILHSKKHTSLYVNE